MDRHQYYFMHMQCKDIMNTHHEMMSDEQVRYDVETRLKITDSHTGAPMSLEQKAQIALLADMLLMVHRSGHSLFSDSAQTLSALLVAAFMVRDDIVVEFEQLPQFYTYAFHSLRDLFDIPAQLVDMLSYGDSEYLMSNISEDYTPALAKKYVAMIEGVKELGLNKVEVNGEVHVDGNIMLSGSSTFTCDVWIDGGENHLHVEGDSVQGGNVIKNVENYYNKME